jgi:hypothetical protein
VTFDTDTFDRVVTWTRRSVSLFTGLQASLASNAHALINEAGIGPMGLIDLNGLFRACLKTDRIGALVTGLRFIIAGHVALFYGKPGKLEGVTARAVEIRADGFAGPATRAQVFVRHDDTSGKDERFPVREGDGVRPYVLCSHGATKEQRSPSQARLEKCPPVDPVNVFVRGTQALTRILEYVLEITHHTFPRYVAGKPLSGCPLYA